MISCDMDFPFSFEATFVQAKASKASSLARHSQMFQTTERPNKAIARFLCFALNKKAKMQARYIIMTVAGNDEFLWFLTIISKASCNKT